MTTRAEAPRAASRDIRLADHVDPRRNSFTALRLLFASAVVLAHSLRLADTLGSSAWPPPDLRVVTVGSVAVDGFFVLSGYLVLGSYLQARTAAGFLWRRTLRLLPGFWVCLVLTAFGFGPVTAWLSGASYAWVGEDSAVGFVGNNALLLIRQFEIAGGFAGDAANGSLHTLAYLLLCYLGVVLAGVLGLWRAARRHAAVVLGILWGGSCGACLVWPELIVGHPARSLLLRFGAMFVVAALLHLYADRIGVRRPWVVLAGAGVVLAVTVSRLLEGPSAATDARALAAYALLAPPALAYVVLVVGGSPRLARFGAKRDVSFGIYLYAWPVQVTLLLAGAGAWWPPAFFLAGLAIAVLLAWLSLVWVERPAVRLARRSTRAGGRVEAPTPVVLVQGPRSGPGRGQEPQGSARAAQPLR